MDYLREMALFVEVAKVKSFRKAAEASGVPSSTLSRRIAQLESAVGLRLFNRTTRSVELTEAGAAYYARCRDIVEAARVAHDQLHDLAERPRGLLRVSATPDFARLFLTDLAVDFVAQYPDVTIEFDLSPNRVDLVAQNFDLALRIGSMPDSGLISRRIGTIRTALFAAPSYLKRAGVPRHPDDLVQHSVIPNQNVLDPGVWTLTDGTQSKVVPVNGAVRCNNFGFMRQLAIIGHGIATLHKPMVGPDITAGRLIRVLPGWWTQDTPAVALTSTRLLPAKTRLFLDMVYERVGPELSRLSGVNNIP
ncbi:LysR substrate-binding domain-containing protein [Novosphingobium sp.]|uniref:LysR family transcriptional regulator n=1 Tax=Novosphingobium sp. TaxID=1874826 RepID=UPI003BAB1FA6